MSLFRPFGGFGGEFSPMFRLMDDYANHVLGSNGSRTGGPTGNPTTLRSFRPKFDVRETEQAYELHGELPGIEQKDINIEFSDPQTLSIRGEIQRVREEGQRPAGLLETETAGQSKITETGSDASSYHQPTVEEDTQVSSANSDAAESAQPTPVTEASEVTPQPTQEPRSKYWLREMSRGSFARTFAFPIRVDQDNVKASLKNGILIVVVPKAAPPQSKRINVE